MSTEAILISIEDFHKYIPELVCSAPRECNGSRVSNLTYRGKPFFVKLPPMFTWGAQEGIEKKTGLPNGKYSISLQFQEPERSTPQQETALQVLLEFEEFIHQTALKYSLEWCGKLITSAEVMEEKFNSMLRYPNLNAGQQGKLYMPNKAKRPSMSCKLPKWASGWQTEVYDVNRNPLFLNSKAKTGALYAHLRPIDFLPKQCTITPVLSVGIWFVNGVISITWTVVQCVVRNPAESMAGICLIELTPEEKEAMASAPVPDETLHAEDAPIVHSTGAVLMDDSDDEGDAIPLVQAIATAATTAATKSDPVPTPAAIKVEPVATPAPEPSVESGVKRALDESTDSAAAAAAPTVKKVVKRTVVAPKK